MAYQYKFGDVTRWVIQFYKDHPNSILGKCDWLKVFRTLVASLMVAGSLSLSNAPEILLKAFTSGLPGDYAQWVVAGLTACYAAADFLYRLFKGGEPPAPKPDPNANDGGWFPAPH